MDETCPPCNQHCWQGRDRPAYTPAGFPYVPGREAPSAMYRKDLRTIRAFGVAVVAVLICAAPVVIDFVRGWLQ